MPKTGFALEEAKNHQKHNTIALNPASLLS
jgi:hypothetical protein